MAMATLDRAVSKPKLWIARKNQRRLFLICVFFGDVLALTLAFLAAYLIRYHSGIPFFDDVTPSPQTHITLSAILIPVWLIIFAFFQLYNIHFLLGGTQEYSRVFNASTVVLTLLIIGTFTEPVVRISRGWISLVWICAFLFVSLSRFSLRRFAYRLRLRGYLTSRTLIVGTDEEARAIALQLLSAPTGGAELIGFVDGQANIGSKVEGNLAVIGAVESLSALVSSLQVEEIIVSTSALPRTDLLTIFQTFGHSDTVELRFSSGLYEIFTTGVRVKEIGYVPLVSANKIRLDAIETAIKTMTDYVGALIGLALLSPLFILIALLIKRESPGPVFHRRRVIGRGGRAFDAFKFRTMYKNGDEILQQRPDLLAELQLNHKLKNDPRITPLGERLRRTSLDELPQFFNILLGQMSLVGPRMITPEEAEKYGKWRMNLLTVKPGLTGLWQVSGRSNVSYEERVRLDMYYIRNYTVWLDLHILLQTIPAVIRGHGAY